MMLFFRQDKRPQSQKHFLLFSLVFASMFLLAVPRGAQAGYWGEPTYAALMKDRMEEIRRAIEGAYLGSLKVAAIQQLNSQVAQLIGGGASGQPLFITSFDDFLYQGPAARTELYMNDFFTLTTRGKSSSANYIGVGDTGGIGGSYASYLVETARQASTGAGAASTFNLEEYTPSPQAMFAEGDFRAFNAFFSNPANNPYGYTLMAQEAYQNKLATEQELAKTKALSSGFLPSEKNGTVIAPAGSIEALQTNIQNLPNLIIASAENPGELLSGVIAATANKMINGLIQNGIGQVQAKIQREIGNVSRQIGDNIDTATRSSGPGAIFQPEINQRTNVNLSPNAPPASVWKDPDL